MSRRGVTIKKVGDTSERTCCHLAIVKQMRLNLCLMAQIAVAKKKSPRLEDLGGQGSGRRQIAN